MKELDTLELINVTLPAIDMELPSQVASFFSFFFHQCQPMFNMQSSRADRRTQVFQGKTANLTVKKICILHV